jgi:hypothetical protein
MTAKTPACRQAGTPPSCSARRGTAYSPRYRDLFSTPGTSSERMLRRVTQPPFIADR